MWSVVSRDCHQKCKRVMVQNPKANSIQRELVQIEASVQNFCRLEAASSLLPPHTSLALGDFGQGGAAASGRSGAGVERRWWRRPITRLQRLVFCIMRQGRCAAHAFRDLKCARSEHETRWLGVEQEVAAADHTPAAACVLHHAPRSLRGARLSRSDVCPVRT